MCEWLPLHASLPFPPGPRNSSESLEGPGLPDQLTFLCFYNETLCGFSRATCQLSSLLSRSKINIIFVRVSTMICTFGFLKKYFYFLRRNRFLSPKWTIKTNNCYSFFNVTPIFAGGLAFSMRPSISIRGCVCTSVVTQRVSCIRPCFFDHQFNQGLHLPWTKPWVDDLSQLPFDHLSFFLSFFRLQISLLSSYLYPRSQNKRRLCEMQICIFFSLLAQVDVC